MGAVDLRRTLPGTKTASEVEDWFHEASRQAAHDDGHSYSGNWNMCRGIEIRSQRFGSLDEAEAYLERNTQKWGPALAVRYTDLIRTPLSIPTYGGEPPIAGADNFLWTYRYRDGRAVVVPVDGLSDAAKTIVVKEVIDLRTEQAAENSARHAFAVFLKDLQDGGELDVKQFRTLRRNRFDAKRAARIDTHIARLANLRAQWEPKLQPVKEETREFWLVAGLASS